MLLPCQLIRQRSDLHFKQRWEANGMSWYSWLGRWKVMASFNLHNLCHRYNGVEKLYQAVWEETTCSIIYIICTWLSSPVTKHFNGLFETLPFQGGIAKSISPLLKRIVGPYWSLRAGAVSSDLGCEAKKQPRLSMPILRLANKTHSHDIYIYIWQLFCI